MIKNIYLAHEQLGVDDESLFLVNIGATSDLLMILKYQKGKVHTIMSTTE